MMFKPFSAASYSTGRNIVRAQAGPLLVSRNYIKSRNAPGAVVPASDVKLPTEVTGDFSVIGTDSSEYYNVDTEPTSNTSPYDHPRSSGSQLRYGGKEALHIPSIGPPFWNNDADVDYERRAKEEVVQAKGLSADT